MTTPLEHEIRSSRPGLERILALARALRGPGGCPWDREQTVDSLTPYLQEETFEVVEAVGERDRRGLREELGDLLFLVAFFSLVAEEEGWGTLDEIVDGTVDKLVRRHPHVFGEQRDIGAGGALRQWEELKRAEAPAEGSEIPSSLGKRPAGLPALTAAFRISEKAGAVGFEWPDREGALDKVEEEVQELRRELSAGSPVEELEKELGDLLYSVVNVARYLKVDPERALRLTTLKFMRRFRYIEERLHARGRTPATSSLDEMDLLWNEAKSKGIG